MPSNSIDVTDSRLFTPFTHPESGVTSYVLTRKVAPLQQGFYFVNDSMSADGRYLWFYCAFPPSGRTLGVVDFQTDEVRHYPETQFGEASPFVDTQTGAVYWQSGRCVWKRGPEPEASVELINSVPGEVTGGRQVTRASTHLTLSADRKEFFIDIGVGLQYLFGSLPLDGGDFQLWHRFDRLHNHAQFSPTDPDKVLFAQENHNDPITGLKLPITDRLWTIRRGEQPHPVMPEPTRVTHEWWDPDGKHVLCVKQPHYIWRVRLADSYVEKITVPDSRMCLHAHASADGRLLVGDDTDVHEGWYRGGRTKVYFLNRDTGTKLTLADNPAQDNYSGRNYHIDPHPRFCCNDRYVVFTTTVRNEVDIAITPVEELVNKTQ